MNKEDLYLFGDVSSPFDTELNEVIGLNLDLIGDIVDKKYPRSFDLEALKNMLRILKEELVSYANGHGHKINDTELEILVKSIRKILLRNNLKDLKLPFRTFSEFYDNWCELGLTGSGSYALRRAYVSDLLKVASLETDNLIDTIDRKSTRLNSSHH